MIVPGTNKRWCKLVAFCLGCLLLFHDSGAQQYGTQSGSIACDKLSQRVRINANSSDQRTLNFFLFEAAQKGCVEMSWRLLEQGASLSARERFGNTALLLAADAGHRDIVSLMLDAGADIEHQNLAGSNALLRAANANRRRMVELLLQRGARADKANKQGITPLLAAVFNGNIKLVELLLAAGADVHHIDRSGKGAMVYAAGKGYLQIAKLLRARGVDINTVYGNGLTALMWAAGHSNDVPLQDGVKLVAWMLDQGPHLDAADNRGQTAVMIAAGRGHTDIVRLLKNAGADLTLKDKQGRVASMLADDQSTHEVLTTP